MLLGVVASVTGGAALLTGAAWARDYCCWRGRNDRRQRAHLAHYTQMARAPSSPGPVSAARWTARGGQTSLSSTERQHQLQAESSLLG